LQEHNYISKCCKKKISTSTLSGEITMVYSVDETYTLIYSKKKDKCVFYAYIVTYKT